MLNILIPMAGRGSRFEQAGYTFPKPLIDVNGEPMISRVIENLKPENRRDVRFIFIVQREHYEKYDLQNVLKNAVGDLQLEIVQIDGITEGAACTALLASDYIDNDYELMIANSDQLVKDYQIQNWYNFRPTVEEDGAIMVFKSSHPKWSYAKVDNKTGRVIEVAEKKVISELATVGIYWFKKGSDFVNSAKDMIRKDIRTNNEFYICPVYNELILNNKIIHTLSIHPDEMMGLGTPEDLNNYLTKNK